jgi:hypothetical protein
MQLFSEIKILGETLLNRSTSFLELWEKLGWEKSHVSHRLEHPRRYSFALGLKNNNNEAAWAIMWRQRKADLGSEWAWVFMGI